MTENYEGLNWDISDIPVGCSTPDEFFEYSYRAESECPDCGLPINGTAQYWSKEEGGIYYLERIDYEPCGCTDYEDKDDELMDSYFKSIS